MKNSKASECSNHVFLFCFWWFDIWGLADTRGTTSPSITQPFLSSNNIWLTCKHNFHTQTHQPRVHTATTSFILYSHNLGDYSPALVTLWLGTRQLVTAPMPQSLLKSFKLANPKPVYPALLSLPLLLLLLLLCHFSRVQLCATPQMAANQAPPSLGFSKQEHWSGLPFPSPMRESEVAQSCPTLRDPMDCSLPGSAAQGIFHGRVGRRCLRRYIQANYRRYSNGS